MKRFALTLVAIAGLAVFTAAPASAHDAHNDASARPLRHALAHLLFGRHADDYATYRQPQFHQPPAHSHGGHSVPYVQPRAPHARPNGHYGTPSPIGGSNYGHRNW